MLKSFVRRLRFELLYLRQPPWDTGISPPELHDFIATHPPGKALDLGCGTGTNAIFLARNGWKTTGVDFVGGAIRQARRKARQAGTPVVFRQGDVSRLPELDGPFDLVLDIGCYHSLAPERQIAYLTQLHNLLAPGGTFLIYALLRNGQGNDAPAGLTESDLLLIARHLHAVNRQDGTDRNRPSAWLTYQSRL